MKKIVAVLLAVGLLGMCTGCLAKKTGVRVVEEISVRWEENGSPVCHVFEDPQKMRLILNQLRSLGQRFSSDTDPEALEVPAVSMTLRYSDGTQRQYQIKPDRYVRVGQAPWQQADPREVTSLRLLLLSLPGDSRG